MKELKSLTEEQFNDLKKIGMLKVLFPNAPENFSEVISRRPEPLENPDFSTLLDACDGYLADVQKLEYWWRYLDDYQRLKYWYRYVDKVSSKFYDVTGRRPKLAENQEFNKLIDSCGWDLSDVEKIKYWDRYLDAVNKS